MHGFHGYCSAHCVYQYINVKSQKCDLQEVSDAVIYFQSNSWIFSNPKWSKSLLSFIFFVNVFSSDKLSSLLGLDKLRSAADDLEKFYSEESEKQKETEDYVSGRFG